MMKRITQVALALAMMAIMPLASYAENSAALRIGYVDLNRALNEVKEGKEAKAKLEADGKAKRQKLEIKQKELKALKGNFEKQRLILSPEALQKKEAQLQQKFLELQRMSIEFEKDFAEKEANLTKPIGEKLKVIISDIGKKGSYTAILPKEMMLYAPPGTDLTDEVITAYNRTSGRKR